MLAVSNKKRFVTVMAALVMNACVDGAMSVGLREQGIASSEYVQSVGAEVVAPGYTYHVLLSRNPFQHSNERSDVLVDFLDETGWYAGGRATLEAGSESSATVELAIPPAINAPTSAYLSVKVVPVGGSWQEAFAEENRPVKVIEGTRIDAKLYYPGNLKSWDYTGVSSGMVRMNSNHDGTSVWVEKASAGAFIGAYTIRSSWAGYGLQQDYALNLETGEVYSARTSYLSGSSTPIVERYGPPRSKSALINYARLLGELKSAVHVVATPGQGSTPHLQYPQLIETEQYLDTALASQFKAFGDLLLPHLVYGGHTVTLRAGEKSLVGFTYGAAEDREIWVDLFVDGQWVSGARDAAIKGYASSETLELSVPSSVKFGQKGELFVKLIPIGATWQSRTAEIEIPVALKGTEFFGWIETNDGNANVNAVVPGGKLTVTGGGASARTMDVRVDLFDEGGNWLTATQVTGTAFEGGPSFSFSANLQVPAALGVGSTCKLYIKLLPAGASWTKAVDEEWRTLTVRRSH